MEELSAVVLHLVQSGQEGCLRCIVRGSAVLQLQHGVLPTSRAAAWVVPSRPFYTAASLVRALGGPLYVGDVPFTRYHDEETAHGRAATARTADARLANMRLTAADLGASPRTCARIRCRLAYVGIAASRRWKYWLKQGRSAPARPVGAAATGRIASQRGWLM
jgi:hypothetical protein